MANQTVTGNYVHHGLNESAVVYSEAFVGAAAAADTVTINTPEGINLPSPPVSAVAIRGSADPRTYQALTLTSYNPATGQLICTVPAGGALAAGDRVVVTHASNVLV